MTPQAIWREAVRNISTGTTRTVTFALILAALTVGLVAAELSTVRMLTNSAEAYQRSGASIITLQAEGRIDGTSCEALAQIENVRAAGAVRTRETGLRAATLPASDIPVFEVTFGFPQLLRSNVTGLPGVILSDELSRTLGLNEGDQLETLHGATRVAGVYDYPTDGRRSGYGYAVLIPVQPTLAFDECWVDAWPISDELPSLLLTTLLQTAAEATPPQLSQLNTSHGKSFDGTARFDTRITRYAAPASLILSFALGYLAVWSRRIQFAASLHVGALKRHIVAQVTLECFSWLLPVGVLATSLSLIYASTGTAEDIGSTLLLGGSIVATALIGALCGAAASFIRISERHLFRYFKNR